MNQHYYAAKSLILESKSVEVYANDQSFTWNGKHILCQEDELITQLQETIQKQQKQLENQEKEILELKSKIEMICFWIETSKKEKGG